MKDLTPFDAETLLMMEDVSGHTTRVNKGRAGFLVYMSIAGLDSDKKKAVAEAKISGRIDNPDYMRRHPHTEDNN